MRFKNTTAIVFLAIFSSSMAFAKDAKHGKAGGKAAKECVEKGGTWEKKKKKCDMPKGDVNQEATSTPAPTETPAPAEAAPTPTAP